jgi:hypothetical protein
MRARRREFEVYWKTQLHDSLAARKNVAGDEIGAVILRLQKFLQLVDDETFEVAAGKILGDEQITCGILELHEMLADRLSRGLRGTQRMMVSKSIQETFLYATGVQYDLPLTALSRKFGAFLQRRGSTGLISFFLRSLLSNDISMRLQSPLRKAPDAPALELALKEIDRLCSSAVDTALDERSEWLKLNRNLASNMIRALESQLGRVAHHYAA